MAACVLSADDPALQADIDAARQAADAPEAVDDYRHALIQAMADRDAGTDPATVLRALWRAAYIAGHLDRARHDRHQTRRARLETAVLATTAP
jgi:hypothetical protein